MTTRTMRRLLWALTAMAVTASAVVILAAARWPYPSAPKVTDSKPRIATPHPGETHAAIPMLEEFLSAAEVDLRRPLVDPAPPPRQPPPPLAMKLAGTIVEPGQSRALLIGADGKVQLKRAGETLDGVELLSIDHDSVTVKYLGSPLVLTATQEASSR